MAYLSDLQMMGQICLAFILGAIIGLEREYHHHPAGIRTFAAVRLGSCVFGLISAHAQGVSFYHSIADPTRIAAQIVSGIGFLGAGVIFRTGTTTTGLTTAATLWATASIGLAIAFDMYAIGVLSALLILLLLYLRYIPGWDKLTHKNKSRRHFTHQDN